MERGNPGFECLPFFHGKIREGTGWGKIEDFSSFLGVAERASKTLGFQ